MTTVYSTYGWDYTCPFCGECVRVNSRVSTHKCSIGEAIAGTIKVSDVDKCLICGRSTMEAARLGYESNFDGEYICWNCWRKHIDPVIEMMRNEAVKEE